MNAEGLLELRGRKDRQVKIRGNRVEPLEVEATIRVHPQVRDAAVIVRHEGKMSNSLPMSRPTGWIVDDGWSFGMANGTATRRDAAAADMPD